MTDGSADPGAPHDPILPLVMAVWVVASWSLYQAAYSVPPSGPPAPAITQIDPNTAPWWELSLLPHIGDALARDIEQFRLTIARPGRPAFLRAADLDDVGGIGPKTIQRLARRLRFPPTTSQPAMSHP